MRKPQKKLTHLGYGQSNLQQNPPETFTPIAHLHEPLNPHMAASYLLATYEFMSSIESLHTFTEKLHFSVEVQRSGFLGIRQVNGFSQNRAIFTVRGWRIIMSSKKKTALTFSSTRVKVHQPWSPQLSPLNVLALSLA